MERYRAPAPTSALARALTPRAATASMFLAFGVGLGAWSGASASIVARIGFNPSTYGVALTLFTAAYLLAMSSAGTISRRVTAKRALVASALASAPAPALAALLLARDAASYFVLQTVYGFLAGVVDLTMNAAGARIERRLGRPVLAGMHGAASAGVAISAAAAGLIATSAAPWISCVLVIAALWAAAAAVEFAVAADRGEPVGAVRSIVAPSPRARWRRSAWSSAPASLAKARRSRGLDWFCAAMRRSWRPSPASALRFSPAARRCSASTSIACALASPIGG
jgi:MFS family permease